MKFFAFGAEEHYPYCLGSSYYVQKFYDEIQNLQALVNLDMIGVGVHTDNRLGVRTRIDTRPWSKTAMKKPLRQREIESPKWLIKKISNAGESLGCQVHNLSAPGLSDHILFLLKGIPAIQIRWMDDPWYHTPEDRLLNIQIEKVQTVTSIVTKTIASF